MDQPFPESKGQPSQQPQRGLYAMPAGPPRRPSAAWRVIKWALLLVFVLVCAVSIFFNFIATAALSARGGSDIQVNERYIYGNRFTSGLRVAVIRVDGVISGDEYSGSAEWTCAQIKKAGEDANVQAVILEVASPGGGVTASDIIYNRILEYQAAKPKKTLIAFFGDVAASGGYYIAAPADKIIAHPTTLTGSIGVMMSSFNVEKLFEKIGVESVIYKSDKFKDILSPYRPATPEEQAMLQTITDSMFARFKDIVMKGRGLAAEEVDAVATGAVFTADQAKAAKLVDSIGYFDDAVAAARSAIGSSNAAVVRYERPATFIESLLGARARAPRIEKEIDTLVDSRKPGFYYLWPGP